MAFKRIIEVSISPQNGQGIKFTDLRIVFNVKKTEEISTNTAQITIYNVSDETAKKVVRVGSKIILRAGYEDEGGVANLFFGDVQRAISKKTNSDKMITIDAFDGAQNKQESNIQLSYQSGISVNVILQDIISAFGLPLGNKLTPSSLQYANGYSFIGKTRDALNEIVAYMGKIWTIQNEQLLILNEDETISRIGLRITPQTGLLEIPEILEDKNEQTDVQEVPKRFRIKTLLYPQITPGVELKLESSVGNGIFKVETVELNGDNYGGDFVAISEIRSVA